MNSAIALLALLVTPLVVADDDGIDKNVFGRDDRGNANLNMAPFRSIVKIETEVRGTGRYTTCTGAWIASNLVLTNFHCVMPALAQFDVYYAGQLDQDGTITVMTADRPGRLLRRNYRETQATVVAVGPTSRSYMNNDWAIIRTRNPDGAFAGVLPLSDELHRAVNPVSLPVSDVILAGHSGDRSDDERMNLPVHEGCTIYEQEVTMPRFLHDCDSKMGSSGSPLIRCDSGRTNCRIVALHHAQRRTDEGQEEQDVYSTGSANVALSIAPAIGALNLLRAVAR